MLKRLRERKGLQGTLLASPAILWMLLLLIIPLLLVVVTSFGSRTTDGGVAFNISVDWPVLLASLIIPISIGIVLRRAARRATGDTRGAILVRRAFKPYVVLVIVFWILLAISVLPFGNYLRWFGYSPDQSCGIAPDVTPPPCFDRTYIDTLGRSLLLAFETTVLGILLGYPLAYFIARAAPRRRNLLLFLILVPLWTNFVIRVYAWIIILRQSGVINSFMGAVAAALNVPFKPLDLYPSAGAVLIGMLYEFLPFMILPMYTSLEKIDGSLYEAAADLGAGTLKTFLRVTLPLSLPGMVAGTILVFVPVMGTFIVSDILGGRQVILVGNLIQSQFLGARDYPFGSAASIILMVMTLLITLYYTRRFGFGDEVTAV
jgi:spermidine/putrescine transport system permease protein